MSYYDDIYLGVPAPSKDEMIIEKRVEDTLETTRNLLETISGCYDLSAFFDWDSFETLVTKEETAKLQSEKDEAEIEAWENKRNDFERF